MSYGFSLAGASSMSIDYNRARMVRLEGEGVAEKYIGGDAAKIFASLLNEMIGMPDTRDLLPKTPVVGSEVQYTASYAATPVVANEISRGSERG